MFTAAVSYTGRPGVHNDGDGSTEGWFAATGGSFVTTEPVGTEDWMPLNDYPAAKPGYDFYDTIDAGKTALANGELQSVTHHGPDTQFPAGSVTYHWASGAPVASYLVEDSVGNYTLTSRKASDGLIYYEAQDSSISAAQQAANADFHAANSPLAAAWRAVAFGESAQVSRLGPAGARRSRCPDLPASASLTVQWHSRPQSEAVPGIGRDHDVHDCLSSPSVAADQLGVPVTAR